MSYKSLSTASLRRLGVMVLFSATLAACGGGGSDPAPTATPAPNTNTPPPPPAVNNGTTSTGTGAFGVLGTANERVAFVPAGTTVLPIVLESKTAGTKVNASTQAAVSQPGVTFSFSIDACSVDSNDLKAICIGYNSNKVAILNLATFATSLKVSDITAVEFASGAPNTFNSYSGGSCILCGVSADVGKQRFVLGGTGGYRVFSYSNTTTATAVFNVPVGENFALLPQAAGISYIVAPEYDPAAGNRKLRMINLENNKSYVWTKSTDNLTDLGADANNFQYSDVDAAAVDLSTGMVVLSTESSADMMLIDFKQASFNETSLTFAAPHTIKKPLSSVSRQTDVSISTKDSLLLTHGEFTGDVGVMQLPLASGTAGAFPANSNTLGVFSLNDAALTTARSACAATAGSSYSFSGKGDPHGLSLFTGLDVSQKGLIIDSSNSCAAIVDLKGLSTAARKTTAGSESQIDTSAAAFAPLVKFVKLQ